MKQEAVATIIKDPQVDQSGSSLPSLNQHDLPAVSFTQNFDQPIVETTNFENRHELLIHFGELHEKRVDLLGLGGRDYISFMWETGCRPQVIRIIAARHHGNEVQTSESV